MRSLSVFSPSVSMCLGHCQAHRTSSSFHSGQTAPEDAPLAGELASLSLCAAVAALDLRDGHESILLGLQAVGAVSLLSSGPVICPRQAESSPLVWEGLDLCISGGDAGTVGTCEGDAPYPSPRGVPGVVVPSRCSASIRQNCLSGLTFFCQVPLPCELACELYLPSTTKQHFQFTKPQKNTPARCSFFG